MTRQAISSLHRPRRALAVYLAVSLAVSLVGLAGCASEPPIVQSEVPSIADISLTSSSAAPLPLVGDARQKAVAAYRDFLERYPTAPGRPEIMRRLADLLVDYPVGVSVDSAVDIPIAPPTNNAPVKMDRAAALPGGNSRRPLTADSGRYAEAVALYQSLLDIDPGDPDNAEILYQLAKAQEQSGHPVQAMTSLQRLIDEYPASHRRLYADTQFRRAELLFGDGAFALAAAAYAEVVQLGDSVAVYEQALYKLGWSRFKQAQYHDALEPFLTLLDRTFDAGVDPSASLARLSQAEKAQVADLFRVISLSFSYLAGVDSISAIFNIRGGRRYEALIYRGLAELYTRKELFTDAARTWLALVLREPDDPEAPHRYIEAIRLYQQAGSQQQVLETRSGFVRRYGFSSNFWVSHSPLALPEVIRQLQTSLVELAGHNHRRALASGSPAAFLDAENWYRGYLNAFDEAARSAEMNFQLAELLYQGGDYQQAVNEYERTAYSRGNHPWAAEAGRSALLAYERLSEGPDANATLSQRLTRSRIRFVRSYPFHPDAAAVLSQTGAALLNRGELIEAAQLSDIILRVPSDLPLALRQTAWTILAQARFQLGDYRDSEQGYRQALVQAKRDDPHRPVLQQGIALSIYRQAEIDRASGDRRGAAALFLQAAANAATDSSLRPRAQLDAAALFLALEEWQRAVGILEPFRRDHPDHQRREEVTKQLAFAYHRSGRHADAAAAYLRLGQGQAKVALRREALMQAADLYQQAGRMADAIAALELYASRFPRPAAETVAVYQKLADLAQAGGDEAGRQHWLREIIKADRSAADDRSRTLAAQAALSLAQGRLIAFDRIALVEPLQESLGKKLAAMKRALAALESAIAYGIEPVVTAATYRAALMYQQLSRSLHSSERPAGFSSEEIAQYNRLLEQQAAPFEQQAIKIYQANLRRISAGQFDGWTEKSLQRLAELWPVRYAKQERSDQWWHAWRRRPSECSEVSRWQGCDPATEGTEATGSETAPAFASDASDMLPLERTFQDAVVLIRGKQFKQAQALLESSAQRGQFSQLLLELMTTSAQNGDFDSANEFLRWLPELDAGKSIAYTELGILLRKRWHLQQARLAYERALAISPDYPLAHLNLGILCDLYLQARECAVRHYREFQRHSTVEDAQVSQWIEDLQP